VQHNAGSKFILLNRPSALNALDLGMIQDLHNTYKEAEGDESVFLYLLYGAGEKAFCAGGDVAKVAKLGPAPLGKPAPQMEFFAAEYALNHFIGTMHSKRQISMLRGYTMGGGAGLSMHGHVRIATSDSVFAMPETALGFFPDVGASYFLTRITKSRPGLAMHIALTGRRLNASEMFGCGLATHYTRMGQIPGMFDRFESLYDYDDVLLANILDEFVEPAPGEHDALGRQQEAIARCFGPAQASVDAVLAALKAEAAGGGEHAEWAADSLALMAKASPTSLAVTHELIRRAAASTPQNFTLSRALQIDYRLARRFIAGGDFYEGVRAILVDKDRRPAWRPAPSPAEVAEYFEPLPKDEKELLL